MDILTKHAFAPETLQSLKFEGSQMPFFKEFEEKLDRILLENKGTISDICKYVLSAGGKRVRPLLVLYSGLIFSGPTDELMEAAIAAELIHMASLVHDDIIDDAAIRRNRPSVKKIWGNHLAVLSGDYLFAKAFKILANLRLLQSLDCMVNAIQNMCQGEILQDEAKFNPDISMEVYLDRIAKKTAIFLECSCRSGACVSGANEDQITVIGDFGLNLGMAFQIIDDILDFSGKTEVMGKPKREDLSHGNITLPIFYLRDHPIYGSWIRNLITKRDFTGTTLDEIEEALTKSGAIDRSFELAVSYIEKARNSLDLLPNSPYKGYLYGITEMLQARAN